MTSATPNATKTKAPARGRPRSEDRTAAILTATHELLKESGYDNLRMQDVAERCGSGLATIYRRWSTKPDLVADAISHQPVLELESSGDPRRDLTQIIEGLVGDIADKREYLPGMMAAAREHPQIRDAMAEQIAAVIRATIGELIEDMHGSDVAGADLIIDAIPGVLLLRAGMLDEDIDAAAYADEVLTTLDALAG